MEIRLGKNRFVLIICGIFLIFAYFACGGSSGSKKNDVGDSLIAIGPYLQYYNVPAEMDLLFRTSKTPVSAVVEWGLNDAYGENSGKLTEDLSEDQHRFQYKITDLQSGSKYYYKVTVDGAVKTGTFYAAPDSVPDSFTLYALGDTQDNWDVSCDGIWQPHYGRDEVAKAIYCDITSAESGISQTCILYSGDLNDQDTMESYYHDFFCPTNSNAAWLEANTITVAAQGNHDGANITDAPSYRDFFPIAKEDGRKGYYSVDYGSVHIAVIEPFGDDWNDEGGHPLESDPQWTWLSNDLSASTAKFKICIYHTPAWTAYEVNPEDPTDFWNHPNNAVLQNAHAKLFKDNGVDLCLSGHNHYYARALVDNIYHLTLGSGGAEGAWLDMETINNTTNAANNTEIDTCYGDGNKTFFTKITVTGETMQVKVLEHTGDGNVSTTPVDSFTINAADN